MTEPTWLVRAYQDAGQKETLGPNDSPRLRAMLKKLGLEWLAGKAWCGTILGEWMIDCGYEPPPNYFRARAWATWGQKLSIPVVGCVGVFARPGIGTGHVGLIVGTDLQNRFLVYGGNQEDSVRVSPFDRNRLLPDGLRWPNGALDKQLYLPQLVSSAASSVNEA